MSWDVVDEASWESFPASDPPGWIGHQRPEPPPRRSLRNRLFRLAGALLVGLAVAFRPRRKRLAAQ